MMYMPTEGQQAFLSLILIPGSLLSIAGSSLIIRNVRQHRSRSSYRNIMMLSSICDIVFSTVWILQPFLSPGDIPDAWIYAVGNHTTCTVMGTFTQFGLSAHWFAGLLSFYFVSTIRFGVKQATFARVLPYLQGFILLWSAATAIVAGALRQYSPSGPSPGCWIGSVGCTHVDDCTFTYTVGWTFGGFPTIIMLLCVVVNNLILYCHVRRKVVSGQLRALQAESDLSTYFSTRALNTSLHSELAAQSKNLDSKSCHSIDISVGNKSDDIDNTSRDRSTLNQGRSMRSVFTRGLSRGDLSLFTEGSGGHKKGSVLRSSDKEWKRVREVGKQSFLYVGAYFLSFGWTFVVNYMDSSNYEYNEDAGSYFLPLLVGQSILLPTMGFFNCCIYFRPKVLASSRQFPNESKAWWIRRAIHGNSVKPIKAKSKILPPEPPMSPINLKEAPDGVSGLIRAAESEKRDKDDGSTTEMKDGESFALDNDDVEDDKEDAASFEADDEEHYRA